MSGSTAPIRSPISRVGSERQLSIEVPNEQPEVQDLALSFEFMTSRVYEQIDKYRDNDVFYCMKCGPYTIVRRRRDSTFILAPVGDLVPSLADAS